ncbi:MAG: hypothetical protein Q9195_000573 [Heterodermia aff. obscurata]
MLDHLSLLRTISLHAWANIRVLHIELTRTAQTQRDVFKLEALDRQGSAGDEILTHWTAICAFIAARITPFQLRLSVLCAAMDLETATDVAESMSQLPTLKKCSIHFGNNCDNKALQSLAKATALRLMKGGDERSDLSRSCWKNLPTEVRLHILMETDLVRRTPPLRVWTTDDKIKIENGKLVPSTSECCLQCTDASTSCFCPARNAAFSDTCVCSTIPTAMFQVSKLFNYEATEIFFSRNVFRFSGDLLATTQFLAGLPNLAVRSMRSIKLHLDFDQLYFGLSKPGSRVDREWHDLISLLRDRLLLSKLWLSILAVDNDTQYDFARINDNGDHDYKWLHTTSFQLLKPLEQLKGLKKFHVSLCWSTEFEIVAEKAVMGPEYDSMAEGKLRYYFCSGVKSILRMPMIESMAVRES